MTIFDYVFKHCSNFRLKIVIFLLRSDVNIMKSPSLQQSTLQYILFLHRWPFSKVAVLLLPVLVLSLVLILIWWVPYRGSQRTWASILLVGTISVFRGLISSLLKSSVGDSSSLLAFGKWKHASILYYEVPNQSVYSDLCCHFTIYWLTD